MEERTVGILLIMLIIVGLVAYRVAVAPSPEEEISGVWKYKEGTEEPQEPHAISLLKTVVAEANKIE